MVSGATEESQSSGQWGSNDQDTQRSTQRSTSLSAATTINHLQNSSSSSPQIEKADTSFSSYSTRNEGQIKEATTFQVISTVTPPTPPLPSQRVSTEQTYGNQVRIDHLQVPENKAQSAHLLSDNTEVQLPPLIPVQRVSQPNDQTQSSTTSRPVSQNKNHDSHFPIPADSAARQGGHQLPSQRSKESNHISTAQTPQTNSSRTGDIPPSSPRSPYGNRNSNVPPPFTHQEYPTLRQQNAATNPIIFFGPPSPEIIVLPQSHHIPNTPSPNASTPTASRPTDERIHREFVQPQPTPRRSYVPGTAAPQRQSTHAGPHQPFISQTSGSHFGNVPSRKPSFTSRYNSKMANPKGYRKAGYVASDPFQVSHRKAKVDAAVDGLTFDDIEVPTAESAPAPFRFYSDIPNNPPQSTHAEPPQDFIPQSVPSQFRNTANAQAEPQASHAEPLQDYISQSVPPRFYSTADAPAPQASNAEPQDYFAQSVPPRASSTASAFGSQTQSVPAGTSQPSQIFGSPFVHVQSQPLFGVNAASPAAAYGQSYNSTQSQAQAPVSPVPLSQSFPIRVNTADAVGPSYPQNIVALYEPQKANQSAFGPYISDLPNLPQPHYLSDPPKQPILSRLTRFFRRRSQYSTAIYPQPLTQSDKMSEPSTDSEIGWYEFTRMFLSETFPKQMYLHFLLRLPSLYFTRVARIFEEADMSLPEIKKMVLETASRGLTHEFEIQMAFDDSQFVPPAFKRLASTWESFIDSVMREWKILNIISVLLLSAILTILQIQEAGEDPLTRYTALFSLMCSLISLLFGCMYIIRFGTMRRTYKAAEWALEAKKTKTLIWWNVWIMLAMPAIWLTWSIILYITCIMSFVWRTGVTSDSTTVTTPELSNTALLAVRISLTIVLGLGVLYGFLVMTTFQRYGSAMDRKWKQRIDKWIDEQAAGGEPSYQPAQANPPYAPCWSYPDCPTTHQPHTDSHYRPFDDANDKYSHPPSHTNIPSPDKKPSTDSTLSDTITQINTLLNNLSNLQDRGGMSAFNPNLAGVTLPPPVPKRSAASPAEVPSRPIPKTTSESLAHPISELPTASTPDLSGEDNDDAKVGFSSGLENRDKADGDVPGDGNCVRFRLPSDGSGPIKP